MFGNIMSSSILRPSSIADVKAYRMQVKMMDLVTFRTSTGLNLSLDRDWV